MQMEVEMMRITENVYYTVQYENLSIYMKLKFE